jgi:hypothetical protein
MKAKTTKADDAFRDIQEMWNSLYKVGDSAIARMKAAADRGDLRAIADASDALQQAMQAMQEVRPVEKLAFHGRQFRKGRKLNTAGPIRKAIERLLRRNHGATNGQLWQQIAAYPPKGWQFMDNHLGRYIEGPTAGDGMDYPRFRNIASEVRKALKK